MRLTIPEDWGKMYAVSKQDGSVRGLERVRMRKVRASQGRIAANGSRRRL